MPNVYTVDVKGRYAGWLWGSRGRWQWVKLDTTIRRWPQRTMLWEVRRHIAEATKVNTHKVVFTKAHRSTLPP